MSNKKQSSIDWLYNNLKSHFEHDGDLLEVVQMSFEQAKEMHKEEIIKARLSLDKSDNIWDKEIALEMSEQYYKETYE
jgi:hypothetical protein